VLARTDDLLATVATPASRRLRRAGPGPAGWQDGRVSDGSIQQLSVPYDAGQLTQKAQRRRRLVRSRLVSLGITVALLTAIYFWRRDQQQGAGSFVVYGVVLGVSIAWLLVTLVSYLRAKRDLAAVGSGVAVRIGPPGIEVAGLYASWPDVAKVATVKGGLGRGPALELTATNGTRARVPLEQISVFPATLDSTTRAYSSGRHGVDLSALDN
jgi:hypothetical protein